MRLPSSGSQLTVRFGSCVLHPKDFIFRMRGWGRCDQLKRKRKREKRHLQREKAKKRKRERPVHSGHSLLAWAKENESFSILHPASCILTTRQLASDTEARVFIHWHNCMDKRVTQAQIPIHQKQVTVVCILISSCVSVMRERERERESVFKGDRKLGQSDCLIE